MSRLFSAFSLAALLVAAGPLSAAPRPGDKADGPAVIGQAKSLNDLLEMTKTLVKNVAGDDLYKEFEKHALPQLDPKKLPGIDPKRPFGLYGTLDGDLAKCRAVLLVPVTGEKDFFDMLEQFDIPVNKGKDPGTFEFVTPPDVPFPVVGRIHKEYAYIALGGADVLDLKSILDPKDVINEKEKAVAFLALRLDRVSADTKKALVGMLRERTDQLPEAIQEPELKAAFVAARNLALRWLKMLGDEAKEVAFRLEADTKTGDVALEMTLTGCPSRRWPTPSPARKPTTERVRQPDRGRLRAAAVRVGPAVRRRGQGGSHQADRVRAKLAGQAAGRGPGGDALVAAIFKSLKATIACGDMDLAAAIRGPNKDGFYTAVGAVHCKEGAQLEKAIREAVKVAARPGARVLQVRRRQDRDHDRPRDRPDGRGGRAGPGRLRDREQGVLRVRQGRPVRLLRAGRDEAAQGGDRAPGRARPRCSTARPTRRRPAPCTRSCSRRTTRTPGGRSPSGPRSRCSWAGLR